jgi:hypothetical protein
MTTSNHWPYAYPEGKIDIHSGTSRSGALKYTDYALRQLMTEAKTHPWFDTTVFVLVTDHCANSAGKVGLPIEKYHIPFLIYAPKYIAPGEIDKISSQIDIAPTLLSLLNFRYESRFFVRNILADDFIERALIGNYQKLGQRLLNDCHICLFFHLAFPPPFYYSILLTDFDTPVIHTEIRPINATIFKNRHI